MDLSFWERLKYEYFGIIPKPSKEIIDLINSTKPKKITIKPKFNKCALNECKTELRGFVYKCPYCKKVFCENHRLPEEHKCGGNLSLPKEMRQIFESWTFHRN